MSHRSASVQCQRSVAVHEGVGGEAGPRSRWQPGVMSGILGPAPAQPIGDLGDLSETDRQK